MSFSGGPIIRIGEVKDGPIPRTGPTRTKAVLIEVATVGSRGEFSDELEISQDAAIDLLAKLTTALKARGCL